MVHASDRTARALLAHRKMRKGVASVARVTSLPDLSC
jgi:hypothetical protein